ncbi:hypothetical protein AQI94_22010 [Streptomyces pseudovenezuelae]|uniref:Methionyl/Valyl/Leucyl/Isoleucyl-tRNA synthetase anticodon-binding domain-containing protein n=1 Tax=Streptomyces pseudovenezuelae TaxID=67350 RepID=A0A124H9Y2_9ACTN|nr:hypothetical protein AQI94_22010 [Streptomyces pseudovenezuelae]
MGNFSACSKALVCFATGRDSSASAAGLPGFAWDEAFDWYVELSETTFMAGGDAAKVSARVLGEVFDVTLRLLHSIDPFVTQTL